jgi:uncharacterized protein YuzE
MNHELREIEWSGHSSDPAYLRFTKLPVAKTEAYEGGEVNLDLDEHNEVVGIEMLSFEAEEWIAVAQIGKDHGLRFDLFLGGAKRRMGAA